MPVMTGSEAIVQSLIAEGVDTVFGIPGHHTQHLYGRLMAQQKIRHVLGRHEQGLGFMAIGLARASGKPATVLGTAGPGTTNFATPLGEAHGDSTPLLYITAEDLSQYLYQDRGIIHESKDQLGLLSRLSQWARQVTSPAEIPGVIHEALRQIHINRPRPAVIEIPHDVYKAEAEVEILAGESFERPAGDARDLERAAERLVTAERPLIWAGGGVIAGEAWTELQELAERLDAPVITSSNGRGSIADDHPLAIGNLAGHGPVDALLERSDAVLAVGTHFCYQTTKGWSIPIPDNLIHIDIDPDQPGKNYPASLGIHADARSALRAILDAIDTKGLAHERWTDDARTARATVRAELAERGPLEWQLMQAIREAIPRDTIVGCDPHLLGYWARQLFPIYEPRTWLYGLGFGTLGYGYPVALGAKLAAPDQPAIAVTGDGGFLFTGQELATAVQLELNVPVVIINDNAYGAIKEDLLRDYGQEYEVNLVNPDFVKYAEAFGAVGLRATPETLSDTLRHALELDRPSVIDVPAALRRPFTVE